MKESPNRKLSETIPQHPAPLLELRVYPPESGQHPVVHCEDSRFYTSHFLSTWGDHFVFTYDRESKKGFLAGNDLHGFDKPMEILPGGAVNLNLSVAEWLWLAACWDVATDEGPYPILVQGIGQDLLFRGMLNSGWLPPPHTPFPTPGSPKQGPNGEARADG
jgi:hypothetical protein